MSLDSLTAMLLNLRHVYEPRARAAAWLWDKREGLLTLVLAPVFITGVILLASGDPTIWGLRLLAPFLLWLLGSVLWKTVGDRMVDLILPFDAALRYARSWWERMRPFDINNFTIDYEREFGAADVLFAEGHYRKAIEAYDQTIRANPLVADFLVVGGPRDRKGRAHEELGQYELAVKSYSEVLRSHPTPFNYETRGLAYHRLGEYEHAIQDFDWDWGKPEGSASPVTSAGD